MFFPLFLPCGRGVFKVTPTAKAFEEHLSFGTNSPRYFGQGGVLSFYLTRVLALPHLVALTKEVCRRKRLSYNTTLKFRTT
jgi:hypothetical protein